MKSEGFPVIPLQGTAEAVVAFPAKVGAVIVQAAVIPHAVHIPYPIAVCVTPFAMKSA